MQKVPFHLMEHAVGEVTYEHTVVQRLYGDIYIGDSERNYFVDCDHEVNLCVHYNVRKPGTYSFNSEYQYYVTHGRMSLKLHWNLGNLGDEVVIEKYDTIEEAKKSKYYTDFFELKNKIDEEIDRQRKLNAERSEKRRLGSKCFRMDDSGNIYYTMMEMPFEESGEYVQIHYDKRRKKWKVSKSPCSISTLWNYLKDFDEVNEKELHLMEYIPLKDNTLDPSSPYYSLLQRGKEEIERKVYYN